MAGWALADTNLLKLHFRDDAGKHSTVQVNIETSETDPSSGGADEISSAAQAISDAALYETEIMIIAVNTDAIVYGTSPYPRPADKAAYKFQGEDGSIVRLQIGAPKATNFGNAWDINPAATDVAALITAMKDHAQTAGGFPISGFAGGTRRRPPRVKRN